MTFGSAAATNVVVVNSTTITATTPAGSAGAVTVTVTVNGQSGSLTNGFTYVVAPTVTSVSPNTGTTNGGTAVTITGTNFAAGATVTLGGTAATNVVVVNSTTITARTPAGSAGAVTVTVTNLGGQSGSLANGYTYVVIADGDECVAEQRTGSGWDGGDDHGDELCGGSDGDVRRDGSDERGGGEQHDDHGDDAGASRGSGDGDGNGRMDRAEAWPMGSPTTLTVAISFGQVAAATPQSPTATVAVTYPGAQTAGDLNVVVVGWNDTTSTVQSVKDSAGNSYSLAIGPTSGTALRQSIYYAPQHRGGNNTVTVTFNQAAAFPDVRILEYRGVTTVDVTAGASGSGTAANSGAATTTSANELIFGANMVCDGDRGGGEWVHDADHHVAGRGHGGRQGSDDGGEQQRDRDVDVLRSLGHADGNVQMNARCKESCLQVCDS